MNKLPLLDALINYHKENNLILSMPGNKCGKAFLRDNIGKEFANRLGFMDITEVEPLDNLHKPEGVIKEAEELLAKTYGVKKAYFMVNGSSGGNIISIFSAFDEGDEVIVERNCHKSIYNGLIMRKLKVNYIDPVIDEEKGIFLPPDEGSILTALDKCKNAKGIILTHPNYFGISYDIENILRELKNRGLKIIIDAAHGAHYGSSKHLPRNIWRLGDYVILSAHKTIPALTQGGYLLVNDDSENIDFYFNSLITTSPSYLIMASLDYARYYLDEYAKEDYENLINIAEKWKIKINSLKKGYLLKNEDLKHGYELDISRYVLNLPEGYSGHKLLDYLRTKKIQAEMSFSRGVVLILSPMNTEEDFEKIFNAMKELDIRSLRENNKNAKFYSVTPKKVLEPYEAFKAEYEYCSIKSSVGRVSKETLIPYPPGIPLVCPGEEVSGDAINIIEDYIKNNKEVLGISNNKIKIIKL